MKDADPGQVLQITPDAEAATKLNTYMHYILQQADAKSPWQYYNLIDVQWALDPKVISDLKAPAAPPLPTGKQNIPANNKDMLNPVLETFLQLPYPMPPGPPAPGNSVWGAINITNAQRWHPPAYATSYSFMLGRASALPTDAPYRNDREEPLRLVMCVSTGASLIARDAYERWSEPKSYPAKMFRFPPQAGRKFSSAGSRLLA